VGDVGEGTMGGTGSDIMGAMGAMEEKHNYNGSKIDI